MSLEVMLKHEASLEASTCVLPFKCLEGSNHLAFGNTLSLRICPRLKLNTSELFISSSIIRTTCRIPGCEAFGNIHKFPSFHCLRIIWGVCSHASSQAALPESLLMRFGGRRRASEFKYLTGLHVMLKRAAHGKHFKNTE